MSFIALFHDVPEPGISVSTQGSPLTALVGLVLTVLMVASMWRVFTRAGQPGWASIVPIYNQIIFMRIADKPLWYIFLGPIGYIVGTAGVARRFGRSTGFMLGMLFLPFVFWPLLAFGSATFSGAPAPQA